MKREALEKLNRHANEMPAQQAEAGELEKQVRIPKHGDRAVNTILTRFRQKSWFEVETNFGSALESNLLVMSGRSAAW